MVSDARLLGVQVGPAEILGGDLLAGGRLDQRRAGEEYGTVALDDDRLIRHRRDVGASGGARAEHGGHLRDPLAGEDGLVAEDTPEVQLVREDLVLHRQEGAPRVDQIDAGQVVLLGDLLRPDVLLDCHRVVRAPLYGRIVGHEHTLLAMHHPNSGHDACRVGSPVVQFVCR